MNFRLRRPSDIPTTLRPATRHTPDTAARLQGGTGQPPADAALIAELIAALKPFADALHVEFGAPDYHQAITGFQVGHLRAALNAMRKGAAALQTYATPARAAKVA